VIRTVLGWAVTIIVVVYVLNHPAIITDIKHLATQAGNALATLMS
jgi:uncharacterized membrane protein